MLGTMSERLSCSSCSESLHGCRYIQVEQKALCIRCYDHLYANTCHHCKQLIGHDQKELAHEDRSFHERCFRCFSCERSLANESFMLQGDAVVCRDCYCSQFSSRCAACSQSVMPGRDAAFCGSDLPSSCWKLLPVGSGTLVQPDSARSCALVQMEAAEPGGVLDPGACKRCRQTSPAAKSKPLPGLCWTSAPRIKRRDERSRGLASSKSHQSRGSGSCQPLFGSEKLFRL
ncbi:four and a half LIM domains protein 3 isoform X1 [Fundulus heteroclitus]|uniref:four and a half LIM domains protein 3 isoform X1 n=1 Tax=Fundulus heteroclitus TaxID=8078 RepID=UPI00165C9851|nr:four and a half LIM domains protein 3 isoform X1 [Fundulus heteroclitus]